MSMVMYDLVGVDDRRFSPHCWRARMALAHKSLDYKTRATRFTDIQTICDSQQKTLRFSKTEIPSSVIAGKSPAIWKTLIQTVRRCLAAMPVVPYAYCPELDRSHRPSRLSGNDCCRHPPASATEDQCYFRSSREKRFGRSLEEAQTGREQRVEEFRKSLHPLRMTVRAQAFLGGEQPLYADYIVFGAFQWARAVSPFGILEDDDPVRAWFERCLDLHDGLGRNAPGYY